MLRTMMILTGLALAAPAPAATEAEKQADCALQAELMGAVQTARLDWVRKDKVSDTLLTQNPGWPAGVADALPAFTDYVYSFRRRELREVDLAAQTEATCLENYDQIQALKNSVTN